MSLEVETSFLSCVDCSSGPSLTCYLALLVLSNLPKSGAKVTVNEPLGRSFGLPGGTEEPLFGGIRIDFFFVVSGNSWALCKGTDRRLETQLLAWSSSAVLPGTRRSGWCDNIEH